MRNKKDSVAVKLENVTKIYTIHHEKPTLMEKLINQSEEKFIALNDINLDIYQGERIGIIGSNGSGKTTLLKIIAGIATPTKGAVKTKGKVVSLIDLEAGFHPNLTGLQNIFLNGMVLGMTKKEILKKLTEIINFADLGTFIDSQLYTYSEGMKLRLGFSVAIHSDPDIFMADENLAVGDENFSKKADKKIREMMARNKTLIIVSHIMPLIRDNCKKIIWIEKGKVRLTGGKEIIDKYIKSFA